MGLKHISSSENVAGSLPPLYSESPANHGQPIPDDPPQPLEEASRRAHRNELITLAGMRFPTLALPLFSFERHLATIFDWLAKGRIAQVMTAIRETPFPETEDFTFAGRGDTHKLAQTIGETAAEYGGFLGRRLGIKIPPVAVMDERGKLLVGGRHDGAHLGIAMSLPQSGTVISQQQMKDLVRPPVARVAVELERTHFWHKGKIQPGMVVDVMEVRTRPHVTLTSALHYASAPLTTEEGQLLQHALSGADLSKATYNCGTCTETHVTNVNGRRFSHPKLKDLPAYAAYHTLRRSSVRYFLGGLSGVMGAMGLVEMYNFAQVIRDPAQDSADIIFAGGIAATSAAAGTMEIYGLLTRGSFPLIKAAPVLGMAATLLIFAKEFRAAIKKGNPFDILNSLLPLGVSAFAMAMIPSSGLGLSMYLSAGMLLLQVNQAYWGRHKTTYQPPAASSHSII